MPTNDDRADWAEEALRQFAETTGMIKSGDWEHNPESVVSDFLVDLRHYCKRKDIDFDKLAAGSASCFKEEVAEEADGEDEDNEDVE